MASQQLTKTSSLTYTSDVKQAALDHPSTKVLRKLHNITGFVAVASAFSAFGAVINGLCYAVSPHGYAHGIGVDFHTMQVLVPTAIVGSLTSMFAGGCLWHMPNEDGDEIPSEFTRWRIKRRVKKEDQQLGWRPRHGARHPRGRQDTYPRYFVERDVYLNTYVLTLIHYRYDQEKQQWTRHQQIKEQRFAFGKEDELVYGLEALRQEAEEFNNQQEDDYLESLQAEQLKKLNQKQMEARQIEKQARRAEEAARLEERQRAARELLNTL